MTEANPSGTSSIRHLGSFIGSLILAAGQYYSNPIEALYESIDNGLDAGADHIWVVIENGTIRIIDNGQGMTPWMLPEDTDLIKRYQEEITTGQSPSYENLKKSMSEVSLCSMEWMMQCIGLSAKNQPGKIGAKGLGALAYLFYGTKAVFLSRPSKELAIQYPYWHGIDPKKDKIPVLKLEPPTREQLMREDISYKDQDITSDSLKDPHGRDLEHGTAVVITMAPGTENGFRPGALEASLTTRYKEKILQRICQISIFPRGTGKGTKEIILQPVINKGIHLLEEEAELPSGGTIKLDIWYDPNSKNPAPEVTREGLSIFSLTTIEGFNKEPWNQVTGTVTWHTQEGESRIWNPNKASLIPSRALQEWVKVVNSYTARVENRLNETQNNLKRVGLERTGKTLSTALVNAVLEDDYFRLMAYPDTTTRTTREEQEREKKTRSEIRTTVSTRVVSEHNTGVEGVTIQVFKGLRPVASKTTSISGAISFGRLPIGEYTLRMVTPEEIEPISRTEIPFSLTIQNPGFSHTFHVRTNLPKPPRLSLHPIIRLIEFDDEVDLPWRQELMANRIDINIDTATPLGQARAEGDERSQAIILSQAVSAALVDFYVKEGVTAALHRESTIFPRVYRQYQQLVEKERRRRSSR